MGKIILQKKEEGMKKEGTSDDEYLVGMRRRILGVKEETTILLPSLSNNK
jgi:hypothetical protein